MTENFEKFQNWANQSNRLYSKTKEALEEATLKVVADDLAAQRFLRETDSLPRTAPDFPKSAVLLKAFMEPTLAWAEELFEKAPASFVVICRGALYSLMRKSPRLFSEIYKTIREVHYVSDRDAVLGQDGEQSLDSGENSSTGSAA